MLDRRLCPFKPMEPYVIPDRFREERLSELAYPFVVMPRPRGIRCLTLAISDGRNTCTPVLSTLKLLPNIRIRELLGGCRPGLDGYLVPRDKTLDIRRLFLNESFYVGQAGFDWYYAVMDYIHTFDDKRSRKRLWESFEKRYTRLSIMGPELPQFMRVMPIEPVRNRADLRRECEKLKSIGYTRVRMYSAHGLYRYGQSTWKEHWCFEMDLDLPV